MPLTPYQRELALNLSHNRSEESHLAGGAAIHLAPNSRRYSNDLDYFHDSEERVAEAFAKDRKTLAQLGYEVHIEMNQPGYIRAIVARENMSTKVEWAHDSAWRFLPAVRNEFGYQLHPIDLAVNKVLALAGRDEARDFLDILDLSDHVLSLGALVWAACGKDPGFTPLSLLDMLRRRGKYRPEDFSRLHLTAPVDLPQLKQRFLALLDSAEQFVRARPPEEVGCLYYSSAQETFVAQNLDAKDVSPHFGRPGGVLPRLKSDSPA